MRIYKQLFKLSVIIITISIGFMLNGTFDKEVLASTDKPIELYYSVYKNYGVGPAVSRGYLYVENLGFYKDIKVCYDCGDQRIERSALYVKTNSDGTEMWRFETLLDDDKMKNFSIKYTVNGKTYWDDNNGKNYNINYFPETFTFGKSKVMVESYCRTVINRVGLVIQVQDMPGDKEIKVRYTEDGWKTYKEYIPEGDGRGVEKNNPYGVIYKHANIPVSDDTKRVDFAVCYVVDGVEYWDNNFGENYTVRFDNYYH